MDAFFVSSTKYARECYYSIIFLVGGIYDYHDKGEVRPRGY